VVEVGDAHRHRAADRLAAAHAAYEAHPIGLDLHATAAAVAALTACEIRVDAPGLERQAGGKALDDRDELRTVRLARGEKTQP
jgi:hypothetical protein